MTPYDSAVLEEFADRLYAKAAITVVMAVFCWFFLGAMIGGALAAWIRPADAVGTLFVLGMSAFMGSLFGYFIGSAKAFKLRLEAQNTLCQVSIERNTRHKSAALETAPILETV